MILLFQYFPIWIGAQAIGCSGHILFLTAVPLLYFEIKKINPGKMLRVLFYCPSLFFIVFSAIVYINKGDQYIWWISLDYTILQFASWIFSSIILIILLTRVKPSINAWFQQIVTFLLLSPFLLIVSRYTLLPDIMHINFSYWLYLAQIIALLFWIFILIMGIRLNLKISGTSVKIPEHFGLTMRENEVTILVIQGLTNHEIAGKLSISPETVKKHIKNIFQKTNSGSKIDLANKLHLISGLPDIIQ